MSQEDKLQTHRTVHKISWETDIHRLSVSQIICKDLHLKCFKRHHAQELTDANCAARMKHDKLLLQKFPQYATDFVFFTDKKAFSFTSPDNRQNKVSGRLREPLKKKLSVFFSAGTALSAIALLLLTVPVSRNFLNSIVQLFSENSSVNLFAVYPFKYKLCLKILCLSLNIMLIVDKQCSDTSAVTNFLCHRLIAKPNK